MLELLEKKRSGIEIKYKDFPGTIIANIPEKILTDEIMNSLLTNGLFYYYIKNNKELMNNDDDSNKKVIRVAKGFNIIFECKKCEDTYEIQFKNDTGITRLISLKGILNDMEIKCPFKCLRCNKSQYNDFVYKFVMVYGKVCYAIEGTKSKSSIVHTIYDYLPKYTYKIYEINLDEWNKLQLYIFK